MPAIWASLLFRRIPPPMQSQAASPRGHVPRGLLGRIEESAQVRIDHAFELFARIVDDRLRNEQLGIVDQDIDRSEAVDRMPEQRPRGHGLRDVTGQEREPARTAELLGGPETLGRARTAHDVQAAREIRLRDRDAYATRDPRDDGRFLSTG